MVTSSRRIGRLGPLSARHHQLRTPTCQRCTTDHYLKFMAIVPTAAASSAPAQQRTTLKAFRTLLKKLRTSAAAVHAGGHVKYFCQKCGSFHHHDFPQGWEPSTNELTQGEVDNLSTLYVGPGESRQSRDITEIMRRVRKRETLHS